MTAAPVSFSVCCVHIGFYYLYIIFRYTVKTLVRIPVKGIFALYFYSRRRTLRIAVSSVKYRSTAVCKLNQCVGGVLNLYAAVKLFCADRTHDAFDTAAEPTDIIKRMYCLVDEQAAALGFKLSAPYAGNVLFRSSAPCEK